jgi:hypothetical protein
MAITLSTHADGVAVRRVRASAPLEAVSVRPWLLRHWGVIAALALAAAVHAPTLRYFFDGDDFVVLGSVEYLGARQYIIDSWTMRDIVPSWRPLTSMIYAAEWELFGLNPLGWRLVNLSVHLASMCVLYVLVLRTTKRPAVGAIAAMIFGVSGAHFDTVNYVTALPHLLSTLLILSSLLAMTWYAEPHFPEHRISMYCLSFVLFVLAFLSNEGAFVFAPLIAAAYVSYSPRWRSRPLLLLAHAAPFAALAAAWLAFYQSCPCEQLKFDGYGWGPHVFRNYGVYLSWIVYPVRGVPLAPDVTRWTIAACAFAGGAAMAIRGPHIARIAAGGVLLALLPLAPVEIWTASRYSYSAVAFFAPLAAIAACAAFDRVRGVHRWARTPALALGLLSVATVAGLYAWQTHAQDARSGRYGERWRLLADELRTNYDDVPDGTTIYIIGGPWQNPMEQYTWVPSVARALYGDAAAVNLSREMYEQESFEGRSPVFLQWDGEHLIPASQAQVAALTGRR